jgi:hypothetical protein
MPEVIVERNFVLHASRNRVWNLIGKTVLGKLPGLERIEIIDENNIRGLLRVRIAFIPLTMLLHVEVVDMQPPQSLVIRLRAQSKWSLIKLNQKITFTLSAIDEDTTEVACKSTAEKIGAPVRLIALRKIKNLAEGSLKSIEERLSQVA